MFARWYFETVVIKNCEENLPSASPISLQAQSIGISSSVWEQILTFANRWLLVKGDPKVNDKRALCWAYKHIVEETTPPDVTGSSDVSDPDFLKKFEDMVKQFEDMVKKDVSIPAWGATLPEDSAFAKSFTENAKTLAINNIPDSNTPIPGMGGWFTCKDLRRLALNPDGTEVELLTRLQDFLCLSTSSDKRIHVLNGTEIGMDTSRSMREVSITLPFQCDKYRGIFNIASLGSQSKHKKPNKTNFTHQVCIFLILSIYLCC
jgi:hypothetical protein